MSTQSQIWLANTNNKINGNPLNPDNIVISYLYLSHHLNNDFQLNNKSQVVSSLYNHLNDTSLTWWFADALFMAPPALAIFATNYNLDVHQSIHDKWINSANILYSSIDSLFYRDLRYGNNLNNDGQKEFWLRANGWVLAGLALLLEYTPKNTLEYNYYNSKFLELSNKIIQLQNENGLWTLDLANQNRYSNYDTGGSALLCFGITWGRNNHFLSEEISIEAINKCYSGLNSFIENGKLLSVQPVGANPINFDFNNTEDFGVGALFLFYSELFIYFN